MAKEETNISHRIMIALSPRGVTLYKNIRGLFLSLDGKRKIKAGLAVPGEGGSDLIGATRVKITPEMVGKTLFVFTVIEAKTATGSVSEEQERFVNFVKSQGGIAGVARSDQDAITIIEQPFGV